MKTARYTIPDRNRIAKAASEQIAQEYIEAGWDEPPPRISIAVVRIILEHAAAPDLLTACIWQVEGCSCLEGCWRCKRARAAIAKAQGTEGGEGDDG